MAQLKTRYTDEHPDVRALQGRIDALEKAAANAPPDAPVTDPAAAAAQLRLREARLEVQAQRERLADVDRRIAGFQDRVEAAPRREQEVLGLMRDYQKLSENYSALLSKKLDAEMASRLEQQQKGQQFRVLDPAYLPERASFPDRGLFALAGAVVGLLLGVGLAVTIDVLDPTMKDAESVAAAFAFPVLAVIPYVKPREQARLATLPVDAPAEAGAVGGRRSRRRARVPASRPGRDRVEDAVSDPNAVRLVESVPQPASGQPLQQAVLGNGHYLAEELRFLAAKVAGLASERFTTIGVVSTGPSEGKTTVALGLTAALARISEQRALLLEADLRQPSLERYLGLPRLGGVSEFLAGRTQSVPVRTIDAARVRGARGGARAAGAAGAARLRPHGRADRGLPALRTATSSSTVLRSIPWPTPWRCRTSSTASCW